jgi:hypothetical protein
MWPASSTAGGRASSDERGAADALLGSTRWDDLYINRLTRFDEHEHRCDESFCTEWGEGIA